MAWQMPPGQWNPGMPPELSMGPTPEQWAMMQQQSWQWSQWQQQYAQWQSQYGETYSQQMQGIGGAPPLPPSNAAPPVPPPPEKPPPPPPHENDEPLYSKPKPAPVPAPIENISKVLQPNSALQTKNILENINSAESSHLTNLDALQKLAEEERVFDIQFKKWEEEIEKWKQENVNHPDRNAYNEYEQKFEACREQLLERRQQMKQKRARLLSSTAQTTNNKNVGASSSNIPSLYNAPSNLKSSIPPSQSYNSSVPPPQQNYNNNVQLLQTSYSDNMQPAQQAFKAHMPVVQQGFNRALPPNQGYKGNITQSRPGFQDNISQSKACFQSNMSQIRPGFQNNMPQSQTGFHDNMPQTKSDIQGTMHSMPPNRQTFKDHGPPSQQSYRNKLPQGKQRYDGRPESNYNNKYNNMSQHNYDNDDQNIDPYAESYGDYDDYGPNKNENTFLPPSNSGDGIPGLDLVPEEQSRNSKQQDVIDITEEQEENVRIQKPMTAPDYSTISQGINDILGDEKIMNILSMVSVQKPSLLGNNPSGNSSFNLNSTVRVGPPTNNQWNKNDGNYNDQYNNRNSMQFNKQNFNNFHSSQDYLSNSKIPELLQSRQSQPGKPNENIDNRQPNMQEQYSNINKIQYGNQNMPIRNLPVQTNSQLNRPLLGNFLQNSNQAQIGHDQRRIQDMRGPVEVPPAKPKWVDEPLFTPSIIVEYEHVSLRLKAREFIEPVHTFDYNHKSKNGEEENKRDFEKEAENLFTRSSRRLDFNNEWSNNNERNSKDSHFKDRNDYTPDSRHDFYHRRQRHDDRDRFNRREEPYRDREKDNERAREPRDRFGRERASSRDREVYRNRDYDRDNFVRGKEHGRDRDLRRERDNERDRDGFRDRDMDRDRNNGRDRDRNFARDRDLGKNKDYERDRFQERKDDNRNRSYSRERDDRKRGLSKESEVSNSSASKKSKTAAYNDFNNKPKHLVMIDDILEPPGRDMRPSKIVIILRGAPGSGKSYLAKLIRDREAEHGGTARIMSIDDYFTQEGEVEEKDPHTGKMIKKPTLKYEYDEAMEETYINSLKRAFKRSLTDGYFNFLIYDAVNDQLKSYADIWNFSRQNGFQVYICTMEMDAQACYKRNVHNRKLEDIEVICSRFFPTPAHHIQLDTTTLLQSASITDVQMEDVEDVEDLTKDESDETEVENSFISKWEKMEDASQLARLDGINKPLRPSQLSMEDYLQLDEWTPAAAKPGKKTVRWADIEERREQEKMRAIGFVVGQTDWNRMTDPTMGSSALTQTKYIERVRRH